MLHICVHRCATDVFTGTLTTPPPKPSPPVVSDLYMEQCYFFLPISVHANVLCSPLPTPSIMNLEAAKVLGYDVNDPKLRNGPGVTGVASTL